MALYGKIKAKLVGKPFCTMVVLAAGSSKRMGRDKLMMEVGGVPVLVRSLQAMQTCAAVDELIYTHASCHSYVVMNIDGKILVVNGENDAETKEIYQRISEKVSKERK